MKLMHNGDTAEVGLPLPTWGEGWGEGVTARRETLTPHPTPLPPELGFTRVRRLILAEVGYIRLRLGEGADRACCTADRITSKPFHQFLRPALLTLCLILLTPHPALAEYPDRPIRLILPFPAGGAVDFVARLVTARMADDLGKPFVIENKAGAGGVIATDATAKAAGDGYTLLLTTPNHTISAALQPRLPYDTGKDLVPVAVVAEVPELLVSHPAAPFQSFAGFVEYARSNPGKLNYASAGNGTLPHVTMELLLRRTGIVVAHIPYRGAAPAMTDLLTGQVQLKMDTYATANQLVADGKLRALAFASRERSKLMPAVPTVAEMGFP